MGGAGRELAGPATGPALRWVAASLTARSLACELLDSASAWARSSAPSRRTPTWTAAASSRPTCTKGSTARWSSSGTSSRTRASPSCATTTRRCRSSPCRGSELNQVWTNLIHNAIDALGDHGTITIRTRLDGECAQVDVADDGPGIPEDARPRVLEPFYTTKAVGSGTGLGLDTCRRIVEEGHGGSISFDTSDAGTTFHVRLPLRR